jgi:hypothetical protein
VPFSHRDAIATLTPRHFALSALLLITGMLYFFPYPALAGQTEQLGPWRWSGVERVVVIPDIHGAYAEFAELLQTTGVIDSSLRWIGGETHLVSLGDLLDRGAESRKVMDLLMRLQREAPKQHGQVHVIAGNHETMNLLGDLRYVSLKEYAAFIDIEPPAQRQKAYSDFTAGRSEAVALDFLGGSIDPGERDPKLAADFDQLYPPGYFGHRSGFSAGGKYGSWLLALPAIIVINDNAFVHGGLPTVTATAPIEELNRSYHADLKLYFELWPRLLSSGIFVQDSVTTNFGQARNLLRIADPSSCSRDQRSACRAERRGANDRQRNLNHEDLAALKELLRLENSPMFGPTGPQWYRGSVRCKRILEIPVLQAALNNLGAQRVVVGHTITTDRRAHLIMDDKLVMLDTGMLVSRYSGRPAALVVENDEFKVQYLDPTERVELLGPGGNDVYPLSDEKILQALYSGAVVDVEKGWFNVNWEVELSYAGTTIKAVFFPASVQNKDQRELAAYQLDKLLGFDLVPPTVARTLAGENGALQLAYPDFLTESKRYRDRTQGARWCPLPPQQQLLQVFDVLIGNNDRSTSSAGYAQPLWDLKASEHGEAFGPDGTISRPTLSGELALPFAVRGALLALDQNSLQAVLGSVLQPAQIEALLIRRDALLKIMPDLAE